MTALLRGLTFLVGLLPWTALRVVGAALGWVVGDVLRIRRRHVEAAMRASGVACGAAQASAMYRSLGASMTEFLWLARRGDDALAHVQVDEASRARLAAALAARHGVVFAASHTGNWDLAACAIARDVSCSSSPSTFASDRSTSSGNRPRRARGVSLTPAEGALRRARGALAAGGAVAMMIDQVPASRRHAVRAEVLGRAAWIDRSPAAVAAWSGAPLVVAAGRRDAHGDHHLHVLAVFEPPRRAGRGWIDEATVAATQALDAFVRAHPSQWLWMHRRWRDPHAATPSTAPRATLHSVPSCKTRSSSPDKASRAA